MRVHRFELPAGMERRPVWQPPAISLATLLGLFLTATAVRHSPLAEIGRPVMTAVSTAAAAVIAVYGAMLLIQARARGLATAVAGGVMVVLGVMTTRHVLK